MISIVIPAYNEASRVGKTVQKIHDYMKDQKHEIIVVSDGSSDNTVSVVKQLNIPTVKTIEYSPNRGKGYAVKTGMLQAKGDYILFSDADLSTPIEQIQKFMPYAFEFDVMIGSRALDRRLLAKKQPFYRDFIGRVFNKIVRIFAVRGIKDTQCGFKWFTRKAAKEVFTKVSIEGFGFDVEALMIAQKLGYKIKEIPVVWINDEATKVSPIKDSIRMFCDVLKVRYNAMTGKYK